MGFFSSIGGSVTGIIGTSIENVSHKKEDEINKQHDLLKLKIAAERQVMAEKKAAFDKKFLKMKGE